MTSDGRHCFCSTFFLGVSDEKRVRAGLVLRRLVLPVARVGRCVCGGLSRSGALSRAPGPAWQAARKTSPTVTRSSRDYASHSTCHRLFTIGSRCGRKGMEVAAIRWLVGDGWRTDSLVSAEVLVLCVRFGFLHKWWAVDTSNVSHSIPFFLSPTYVSSTTPGSVQPVWHPEESFPDYLFLLWDWSTIC